MSLIDLTEIPSDDGGICFERFAQDLLSALGWTIIIGAGKGADGGRDIVASQTERTATGRDRRLQFVVQCKHYAGSGRTIGGKEITESHLMPAKHACEGWLLITSTHLSSDATLNVKAARNAHPGVEFDYWDADTLQEHLLRDECRNLITRYFPASYARCANILTPRPAEIRDAVEKWLAGSADRSTKFSIALDADERLLSWAASTSQTLSKMNGLLSNEALVSEFFSTWNSNLARGDEKAPSVLLLEGLSRLYGVLAGSWWLWSYRSRRPPQV